MCCLIKADTSDRDTLLASLHHTSVRSRLKPVAKMSQPASHTAGEMDVESKAQNGKHTSEVPLQVEPGERRASATAGRAQGSTLPPTAICRVGTVLSESPASIAGLLEGDLLLRFGDADAANFVDIGSSILPLINDGRTVKLSVLRSGLQFPLMLTPARWEGSEMVNDGIRDGMVPLYNLLGCLLLEIAQQGVAGEGEVFTPAHACFSACAGNTTAPLHTKHRSTTTRQPGVATAPLHTAHRSALHHAPLCTTPHCTAPLRTLCSTLLRTALHRSALLRNCSAPHRTALYTGGYHRCSI